MPQKPATKPFLAVPGYSRLFRRGATYYFRVVVPLELRKAVGKTEIIRSLRTTNFADAKRLVAFESANADSLLQATRRKLKRDKPVPRHASKLSDAEIHRFVLQWFREIERDSQNRWQNEGRFGDATERQEALENLRADEVALSASRGDGGPYRPEDADRELDAFLSEQGINCRKDGPEYRQLSSAFHLGLLTHVRRDIARFDGKAVVAEDPLFREVSAFSALPAARRSITLGELLDRFLDYIGKNRSETTFSTYQTPARVMREVLGETTPLNAITRESIDRLFGLLRKRPRNMSQRYRGLTTEQAIEAAAKRGDRSKLSAKSLKNYHANVLAVFNFAVDEKLMDGNPANFRSIREQFRIREKKKKALFTPEQLSRIFHSPLYAGGFQTADARTETFHWGRFFVPLLALFQGLRCNEACQLYVEDVKEQGGIPFIAIREEREDRSRCEKRLKNEASKRSIPLHPVLLHVGFMDFVARRRQDSASGRLFPDLPMGKTGRYSNPFSKWFARFLRSVFTEKLDATFHSFRHNFRDALRAQRVGIEAVERLGGWKSPASEEREYGDGLSIKMLREEIDKVEYLDLDLSHLYAR